MLIRKIPNRILMALCCASLLWVGGGSRQQKKRQKNNENNKTDAYEQFVKKYPSGEFTAQAQARLKELYEERDWQKARDADTAEAYQAFLKQYPEGKWTEEARIRVENFTLAQTPGGPGSAPGAAGAAVPGAAPNGAPQSAAPTASAPQTQTPRPPKPQLQANPPAANPPAAAAKPASGTYAVQLGAFKSGTAAANRRWERLQKQYPKLLAGLSSKVVPKKTTSGTLYRLQAVGMSESHARKICKNLKAKSQPCIIIRPTRA
jgi:cell division protein FtsN